MDGTLKLLFFLRTKVAGNDDTGSYGDAVEKADQKEDQVSGRTDCGESVASEKVPYNERVRHVVKLLKEVPEKERNGKSDDPFPDCSLCHRYGFVVCCHQKKLLS